MHGTNKPSVGIKPIYCISGDEILLVNEALDQIRQAAKKKGFLERQIYHADTKFDANRFYTHTQSPGLFSDKTLIELRLPTNKLDAAGQNVLMSYIENPSPDVCLLIQLGKLSTAQKNTKWIKALMAKASFTALWPPKPEQFGEWLRQRASKYQLTLDQDALVQLSTYTQGNLLAADQALQKLQLLDCAGRIDQHQLQRVLYDASRFTVFDLSELFLLGKTQEALHCLKVLRETGVEPILVLWAIARDIKALYAFKQSGQFEREWPVRLNQLKIAARRIDINALESALVTLSDIDLSIKGLKQLPVWESFSKLLITLS